MTLSAEEKTEHLMIGEATVNLIFKKQEISLTSLIDQLDNMADNEEDDDRLLGIWQARKWLIIFNKGWTSSRRPDWLELMTAYAGKEASASAFRPRNAFRKNER